MGYIFAPLLVIAIFTGIFSYQSANLNQSAVQNSVTQSANDGQRFIAYRNAVQSYLQANPAFTGAVSNAMLTAQGNQFSTTFLAKVANVITVTGVSGRIITCYGNLNASSISSAMVTSQGDASIGLVGAGNTWTSLAPGVNAASQPLATTITSGDVVSVIQIGS